MCSSDLATYISPTRVLPTIMSEDYLRVRLFLGDCLTTTACGTQLSLRMHRGGQLEIWTHVQNNGLSLSNGWECTRVIKLFELIQRLDKPRCIWSGERSNMLLIMDYTVRRFYKAYLDNGTLEEITNPFPDHHSGRIMPMEMDWPTFFKERLCGP